MELHFANFNWEVVNLATNTKKNNNILIYKKRWQFNIGIVLFGIMLVYLLAMVIIYLTANRTTSYEVRMGSILDDTAYTGMAIRQEQLVTADQSGYVNYYSTDNTKVKVGSKIYTTSDQKLNESAETSSSSDQEEKQLTGEQQASVGLLVQSFTDSFSDEMFSDVYSFKESVKRSIADISSASKANYLNNLLENSENLTLTRAKDDGIIVYSSDGYEALKPEDVTVKMFDRSNYTCKEFSNNMKISAGEPVYKLVTDEKWTVVVPIKEETATLLKEKKSIRVRFTKDNQTMIAKLKIKKMGSDYMAYLDFDRSMIRYATDRFLELELILADYKGLKIPKSARTDKAFYVVPTEYLTQGGNSNQTGVIRRRKNKKQEEITEFIPATVYFTENDMAYLEPGVVEEGDILLKPESNTIYIVREQRSLTGVYNINKGYAVFKQINILCESDDYYIVRTGDDYGLSNYDHIALDSSNVKENDVITQ